MRRQLGSNDLIVSYADVEDPIYLENIAAKERTAAYNLDQVLAHLKQGGRLLDVGSYCGAFLKEAKTRGFAVTDIEPSRWAAKVAADRVAAPIITGTLADLPPQLDAFDVISLWDVMEHFADPAEELRRLHSRLAPDGVLVFSTMDIDNWFPRLTGRRWPWLMEMHLFYFTTATMADMLNRCGFKLVDVKPYCHIITLHYLLSKLGTLGIPLLPKLAALLQSSALGDRLIPFSFGDIKLYVCKKA